MTLQPHHVAWQKKLLDTLKVGGVWGVPSNGMIVRKTGTNTVEIVSSADNLKAEMLVRAHIEAAGYKITRGFTVVQTLN
jgi:hypothetical protein